MLREDIVPTVLNSQDSLWVFKLTPLVSAFPENWVRKYYWPCSNAMLFTSYLNVAGPVAVGDFQVENGSECVIPEPGH